MSGLDWLRCPHCAQPLSRRERGLHCPTGHAFDIARQGYVNLLGRAAPANADTPAMLDARARFLGAGHYRPLTDALVAAAAGARRILEVGAGTGHHLAAVLAAAPEAGGLATDVSVAAARRAARTHPRMASIVADTWAGLPLVDGAVDTLLCVFAPRNPAEFSRVLSPSGRLVVAVPTPGHLAGLRERYGLLGVADDKTAALLAAFPGWTAQVTPLRWRAELTADAVSDLIAMGPNAFHGTPADVTSGAVDAAVDVVVLTRH